MKKRTRAKQPARASSLPQRLLVARSARGLAITKRGIYSTKHYGHELLQHVCKMTGNLVLPKRVYETPDKFSIAHFKNLSSGGILIRSDPKTANHSQSLEQWVHMRRKKLYLKGRPLEKSEAMIKKWMNAQYKKHTGNIRFIVHKVRPLSEIDNSFQVNVNLEQNTIVFHISRVKSDTFRDETERKSFHYEFEPWGYKLRRPRREHALPPELPITDIMSIVKKLTEIIHPKHETSFELSGVTYKDAPDIAEFYDLILGKAY